MHSRTAHQLITSQMETNSSGNEERRSRWGSNSKFNRILGNIERSILGQFNNSSGTSSSHTYAKQISIKTNKKTGSRHTLKHERLEQKSSSNRENSKPDSHENNVCPRRGDGVKTSALSVTKPPSTEQAAAKLALNKHQRQLASTLSSSQLATSRLSIPPPHANCEARSQNHNIMLGCGGQGDGHQLFGLSASVSSETARNSCIAESNASTATLGRLKLGKPLESRTVRSSSSPTSSAKSLPAVAFKPGSQASHSGDKLINDEEEFGFPNYQSRRSFWANKQNDATREDSGKNIAHQNNEHNQVNPPYRNYNPSDMRLAVNHTFNNPCQLQSNNMQNVHMNQHIFTGNPLPVAIQANMNNENYQQNPAMHTSTIHRRHFQPHIFEHSNGGQFIQRGPPNAVFESNQQIYANAPPKPRRYQYYNAPNQQRVIMPQMMRSPQSSSSLLLTSGQPRQPVAHNRFTQQQTHYNQCMTQHRRQQNQQFSPSSNRNQSYINLTTVTNNDEESSRYLQSIRNYGFIQPQHRDIPIIPQNLVKSKSSLDCVDVTRLRQEAVGNNFASSTLGIPNNQQPEYETRWNNHNSDIIRALPQQVGGNLQRSKSVTHLLPENDRQHQSHLSSRQMTILGNMTDAPSKFHSISSASTTRINLSGLNNHEQTHQYNQSFPVDTDFSSHHINNHRAPLVGYKPDPFKCQLRPNRSSYVSPQTYQSANQQAYITSNLVRHQTQPNIQNDAGTTNITMPLNQIDHRGRAPIFLSNGNRIMLQPMHDNPRSYEQESIANQSLDDKIRYLMIGDSDNNVPCAAPVSFVDSALSQSNCNNNLIYQATNNNSGYMPTTSQNVRAQNNATASASIQNHQPMTIHTKSNSELKNCLAEPSPSCASSNNPFASGVNLSKSDSETDSNIHQSRIGPPVTMGNRQNRYEVNQENSGQLQVPVSRPCTEVVNSQLIVDLTTPRVLARTQTTIPATTNQLVRARDVGETWSMNQVGLPQTSSSSDTTSSSDSRHDQTITSENPKQMKSMSYPSSNLTQDISPMKIPQDVNFKQTNNSCERNAPYYYSDLKSEEQRQALLSIVQQKSLSPPPQLLSRSLDQSSTRLAHTSASSHPNHARCLAKTGAQNSTDKAKNQSITNLSSPSTIDRNIDKLFESPIVKASTAQSMLTLDCSNESSHASLMPTNNFESISSGYSSGDVKGKSISKSKSLENICHVPPVESIQVINPVYENIRQSNKLLDAIKNSSSYLSRERDDSNNTLTVAKTNSDESMDSILGSSLEDSDSGSDIIDEVQVSTTDNHVTDMTKLIEQLKSNHSKLCEEYKSTLVRISKTINAKNVQVDDAQQNSKLARRLHLLELKLKKCESRSKNQLALIQMMEKVLRQTRQRSPGNRLQLSNSGSSPEGGYSSVTKSSSSAVERPKDISPKTDLQAKHSLNFATPQLANSAETKSDLKNIQADQRKRLSAIQEARASAKPSQEIVRAVVKESDNSPERFTAPPLLTRDTNVDTLSETERVTDNSDHPTCSDTREPNSRGSCNSDNHESLYKNRQRNPLSSEDIDIINEINGASAQNLEGTNDQTSDNTTDGAENHFDMIRDDDDFIEFLSTDKAKHHRSQFDASQFSASDFNTSTSTSNSNTSGLCDDSLSSSLLSDSRRVKSPKGKRTLSNEKGSSIMKSAKNGNHALSGECSSDKENQNHDTAQNHCGMSNKVDKFNNVLGNVIDVDIGPLSNLSRCSTVTN